MSFLTVILCTSLAVLVEGLTPKDVLATIDTSVSIRRDFKKQEIDLFKDFVKTRNKAYADENEIISRMSRFKNNTKWKKDGTMCPTPKGSDEYPWETIRRTGYIRSDDIDQRIAHDAPYVENIIKNYKGPVPESFDWRDHFQMTPVRNQESCGSCWAFASIAMLESQIAILTKQPAVELSKSQLVECSTENGGCGGGNAYNSWSYLKHNGYETEQSYPYRNMDGKEKACNHDEKRSAFHILDKEFNTTHSSNDTSKKLADKQGMLASIPVSLKGHLLQFKEHETMKKMLLAHGPLAVSMVSHYLSAGNNTYGNPKIFDIDPECCKQYNSDHLVVLVGYGHEDGKDYWIIRNSWGPTYGKDGYFKIQRGINLCHVEEDANIIVTALDNSKIQ